MKLLLLLFITLLPFHSFSQTLFGTTGGTLADSQNQFDFSIGEPIVGEVSGTAFTSNIGFQQPNYDFFTSISKSEMTGYQIFPNPFSDALRFVATSEIELFFLMDASGKEVFRSTATGKDFEFKATNLPKGFYHLGVQLANGKTINSKIIHQ